MSFVDFKGCLLQKKTRRHLIFIFHHHPATVCVHTQPAYRCAVFSFQAVRYPKSQNHTLKLSSFFCSKKYLKFTSFKQFLLKLLHNLYLEVNTPVTIHSSLQFLTRNDKLSYIPVGYSTRWITRSLRIMST